MDGRIIEGYKNDLGLATFMVQWIPDNAVEEVNLEVIKQLMSNVLDSSLVAQKIAIFEKMAMSISTPKPFRRRRVRRASGGESTD